MVNNYNRIELSSKSFFSNLDFFNEIISDDVVISIVIKANAYGQGNEQIVPLSKNMELSITLLLTIEKQSGYITVFQNPQVSW